ncbi:MAG: hypothetical protein K8R88_12480 [Armatimonadetes bacterium]|nr:hypothetical protein [Armatimonadota bacterium]
MKVAWDKAIALAIVTNLVGCTSNPTRSGSTLHVIYSYSGTGARPRYLPDERRKIQGIRGGPLKSTINGMTSRGGCSIVQTFSPAVIQFADGSEESVDSVTLEGWSGSPPSLVSAN